MSGPRQRGTNQRLSDSPPERGFAVGEYKGRLENAQRLMSEQSLDALLLTTEPEFRYFTGFLTQFWQSPTRPWHLVVPASGDPVAVIPEIGRPLMSETWVDDIRTWPSPRPDDDGISLVASALARSSRVGVPMGQETILRMPLEGFSQLQEELLQTEFVDAANLVARLRMVKSEAEIAKIAHICQVASDAFDLVPEFAGAGVPLATVFKRFKIALLECGADDVPYLVGGSAPGGYADVISPPDDRPVEVGDILMMDTGAIWDGYFCDFDRNFAISRADEASKRAYDTLWRATEAGLSAARPDARCSDICRAMEKVIEADGYEGGNVSRSGHGLGMQLTERPSITQTDDTRVETGMVLTLEPGLQVAPGRTMVHEENIVIGASGLRLLSRRAPAELPFLW